MQCDAYLSVKRAIEESRRQLEVVQPTIPERAIPLRREFGLEILRLIYLEGKFESAVTCEPTPEELNLRVVEGMPVFDVSLRLNSVGKEFNAEFECPYCGQTHTHGWGLSQDPIVPSHRSSHCYHAPTLLKHGYFIVPDLAGRQLVNQSL
jgi:hypothetical protein